MFLNSFNNIRRWFCCSSSAGQLELRFLERRFSSKQNDLFNRYRCDDSLCSLFDLFEISRPKRFDKSKILHKEKRFYSKTLFFGLLKLGATPLTDNDPSDNYFYQILVFTGHRRDAGTRSKVFFRFSAEKKCRTIDFLFSSL